jgi:hypothetical protein
MPSCVQVPSNPVLNRLAIFLAVLNVLHISTGRTIALRAALLPDGNLGWPGSSFAFVVRQSSSDLAKHFICPELFLDVGWVVQETGVEVVSIDHVLFVYDVDGTAREGIRWCTLP